jgi:hypothetical protein
MAMNSVGLNLLLQASPQQVQDLLLGLQPGAILRGRVVDVLPQGKAVIQLQGQNLLAQLPPAAAGQAIQKGDILSLQVSPPSPPQGGGSAPANAAGHAQTLTLRLLPNAAGAGAPPSASVQSPSARVPLPPQAVIEQALIAAKVPVNSATLAAAKILAAHGLPLDAQTLQSVVQIADSLLAAEQAQAGPISSNSAANAAPSLPQAARTLLQDALPALRLALQSTPVAAPRLVLQQALSLVESALSGSAPAPASSVAPTPLAPQEAAAPPLQAALQAVLDSPTPANLQALQLAIAAAPQASNPGSSPSLPVAIATAAPTVYAPSPAALPARREAAVLLIQSLPPEVPGQPALTPKLVSQAAQTLAHALEDPQSPQAQTLIRSVQAQFPQAQPTQVLRDAQEALTAVVQHFDALPAGRPLPGPQALAAELEAANLPVPQQNLNQLPRETVYEAVAWLKTRDLPAQRPLVEAAAQFLSRGQAALGLAEQAARAGDGLPEGLLTWRPGLKQAFENLDQAIQRSTLKLDAPDLGSQLKQWPKLSGLDLEKALFQALETADPSVTANAGKAPLPTLREALAQVQQEVKQALRDPAGAAPNVAPKLEQAASDAGRALQSLNALPLQAQPAPAFQTVTLPLALPLQGPLNSGQLSVTWRQGQERDLNDKEPVNVAVALNTESLGEVRVLLQVWKGAVSASVKTEDQATADFLAGGAADLKDGFAQRTPFRVRALDFAARPEGEALPALGEAALLPQGPGLNLSA